MTQVSAPRSREAVDKSARRCEQGRSGLDLSARGSGRLHAPDAPAPALLDQEDRRGIAEASLTVAVAFAGSLTSTFCTARSAFVENSLCLTSLAQLPLSAEVVTESASLGVKIWVQMRLPSPARLAVWRSDRPGGPRCGRTVTLLALASLAAGSSPPHPPSSTAIGDGRRSEAGECASYVSCCPCGAVLRVGSAHGDGCATTRSIRHSPACLSNMSLETLPFCSRIDRAAAGSRHLDVAADGDLRLPREEAILDLSRTAVLGRRLDRMNEVDREDVRADALPVALATSRLERVDRSEDAALLV